MKLAARPRRLLLLCVGAVVVAVGTWAVWPRTAITRENAAKIKKGMTLAEVEAILGGSARDERTGPVVGENEVDENESFPQAMGDEINALAAQGKPLCMKSWWTDQVLIVVFLDGDGRDGRVFWHWPSRHHREQENPLDMLCRWLRV